MEPWVTSIEAVSNLADFEWENREGVMMAESGQRGREIYELVDKSEGR